MKTKKKIRLLFFLATAMMLITVDIYPCSTVLLKNKNSLLVCRNLDTPVNLPGYLCVNKRGEIRTPLELPIENCHKLPWTVKYGSVSFTAMGRGFSDGGMNEKGLVIEEMSLPSTDFLIDSDHTYLTSPQWVQYQLDNFTTVEEVIDNLDLILPIGWVWHFFISDKNGNSASIEFMNGELIVHKEKNMPYQCLSNSLYSESHEFYNSLSDQNTPIILDRQSDQDNSLDRFAIAVQKSKKFANIKPQESVDYAFGLLSSIAGTKGYAKRSIVYDINNLAVYFRTDSNSAVRKLYFKELNFNSDNLYLDITKSYQGNINKELAKCTVEKELDLHNELANLLSTFFKPTDEFPNLGVSFITYLDKTYDYIISSKLNSELKEKYIKLDNYLKEFYSIYDLPGFAIGVIKNDQIVFAKGYGYQDIEDEKPMTFKSTFHMASISKTFVATAIMQLHESGKLNIDTPIVKYLPYFKLNDDRYKNLTARQLLNHTSGLADYHDDSKFEWNKPQHDDETAERFVRNLNKRKLYKPVNNFAYSSISFDILPDLIAKVSGLTFEEYIKNNILQPLEMKNSTFFKNEVCAKLATQPYELETDSYKFSPTKYYPYNRMCAGSGTLHSNVYEMFNWCSAYLNKGRFKNKEIINTDSYNMMLQPHAKFDWIGLGWFLKDYRGKNAIGHSGSDIGFSLRHTIVPEESLAVIALSNSQVFPSETMAESVLDIILGYEPSIIKQPVSIPFREKLATQNLDSAIVEFQHLKQNKKSDYDFSPYNIGIIAVRQMQQGKVDLSIDLLNFLIGEYPKANSILYYYRGLAHLKKGEKRLAINDFNKVIELNPSDIRAMEILDEISIDN